MTPQAAPTVTVLHEKPYSRTAIPAAPKINGDSTAIAPARGSGATEVIINMKIEMGRYYIATFVEHESTSRNETASRFEDNAFIGTAMHEDNPMNAATMGRGSWSF